MADKTTTSLTGATTPLSGDELLYLIQGGNSRGVASAEIVKISHNQAWSTITSTPTTLDGYGITDAATSTQGGKADTALQPGDIGDTVQAHADQLDDLAALAPGSDGQVIGWQDGELATFNAAGGGDLLSSNNLSDLSNVTTAKTNLGLGTVATSNDYSDLDNLPTLGTGAALDAPSDPDLSNDTDKLALRGDVDANLVLQYAADDTALKALDIGSRKAALNLANEGWWLPTSDDISAQITAGDPRYQPTSGDATGASGGWYQAGSVGKGNPWVNVTGGADIIRLADRLMVGCDAVAYDGKTLGATDDDKSWVLATHIDYLLPNAALAAVTSNYTDGSTPSSGSVAIAGQSRHNGASSGAAIGGGFAAWNDGSATAAKAWGGYFEAVRAVATAGFTHAAEFDITLLAVSPRGATHGTTPYTPFTNGSSHGLWIGCGGGATGTLYNSDAAIGIVSNGAFHNAGIVMFDGALYRDGGTSTGRGHAMRFAANYAIEQYTPSTDVLGASLAFNVSDATYRQELRIDDNGLTHFNADGKRMFRALWATSAVNGIELVAAATGGTVIVRPTSVDDTDAPIAFRPLGAANGFLQNGTGTVTAFRWNGAGFAFGGNAPVARPDWTAATGTASRATFDTASVTLPDLAQRVKAMIDDNLSNGLYQ